MQAKFFISFVLLAVIGVGQASGQSAFLDDGQSGTSVGLAYLNEDGTTGIGLAAGFSTERRSDVTVGLFTVSSERARAYGGSVGVTLLGHPEDSDVLAGLPITLQYLDPPGRGGPTLTGSVGVSFYAPHNTGNGTRFVFSMTGSIAYILGAYRIPADRTIEIIQASMGQSISVGNGNFCLLSVVFGYSTASPSHKFVGFEIGLLFPD